VQGFSGVTVADITGPAKVTRATFYYYYYYYFTDKTQLFVELGTATYIDVPGVVESFSELHGPADRAALMHWIDRYFAYLDRNGAFVARSSEDAPDDARFRAASERSYRRTAQALGDRIDKLAATPLEADSHATGLTVMAMLERSWLVVQGGDSDRPTEQAMKNAICELLFRLLNG
jgi:AcrR family transcriptional regulator